MKLAKLKITKFFIILIFFSSCKSSYTKIGDENANYIPYFSKIYEADSLYLVENYQRSYEILDSLFKKYEPIHSENEYLTYITCKIILNKNKKEIKKNLIYLLENDGYFYPDMTSASQKMQKFLIETDTLGIDTRKAVEKYRKSIDMPLRNLVLSMTKKDQEPRGKQPDFEKMKIVDAENTKILDSLLKINKYPRLRIVGKDRETGEDSDVGAIMIHTSQTYKETFLMEKVYDLLKKGEITPTTYSMIYDRYNLYINDELYYFTNIKLASPEEKKLKNERRKAIGLYSLDYIPWKWKKIYNYEF